MHIEQETERSPGPDVVINCPACHERGVPATTYDQRIQERLYVLFRVNFRVNDVRSTWVVCTACHAVLRARVTAAELEDIKAEDLTDQMYFDAGLVAKVLAIIAVLLAVFPLVGTGMALIALFMNRKFPTWSRTLSFVALGLSLLALVGLGLLMVFKQPGAHK